LRPGTLLGEGSASLSTQSRRLREFFEDEGYFDTQVGTQTREVPGAEPNRGVEVKAAVRAGKALQLRDVWFEGTQVMPTARLEAELHHRGFLFLGHSRFRPVQFRQDLQRLTELHHESGWPEARVSGDWFVDMQAGAVDVVLRVEPGPRLQLVFTGNAAIARGDLAEAATFASGGIVDEVEMENTAAAITRLYQREGYYAARVSYASEVTPTSVTVTYNIVEGPSATIAEVTFEGVHSFSDGTLRDGAALATSPKTFFNAGHWVDTYVIHDVRALAAFYHEAGFPHATVRVERQVRADGLVVHFIVDEGPRRLVAALSFDGLPSEVDQKKLERGLRLMEAAPFAPSRLDDDRRHVLATLGASGYIHADAEIETVSLGEDDTGDVVLRYHVQPGARAFFDGLFVRGNFRTGRAVIDEALGLGQGDPLDLVAVGRARRRLRDLGIFTSVELRPAGPPRPSGDTWLLAAVQERTGRSADAVVAFATDELLSVGADYLDINLFGRAIRFETQLRLSNASEVVGRGCGGPVGQSGFDLRCGRIGNRDLAQIVLRAPRPQGLPFDVEGATIYDYQDKPLFRERRIGLSAGVVRAFEAPPVTTALGYELVAAEFERAPLPGNNVQRPLGLPSATIGRIVPRLGLDRRDSFTDPRRGWKLDLRLELAHAALAGPLRNGASFVRGILSGSAFLPLFTLGRERLEGGAMLGGPVVLAVAGTLGAAEPWAKSPEIPDSEAFYYGGDQNVRGLPERASTAEVQIARFLSTGSLELRWYVWQGIGFGTVQVAPFTDLGAVGIAPAELRHNLTVTVGGAVRYVTPVGPLSLAWARPVTRPAGIPGGGRLHFSFGYTF
jgi:outer membrane protein assembly factor BamA